MVVTLSHGQHRNGNANGQVNCKGAPSIRLNLVFTFILLLVVHQAMHLPFNESSKNSVVFQEVVRAATSAAPSDPGPTPDQKSSASDIPRVPRLANPPKPDPMPPMNSIITAMKQGNATAGSFALDFLIAGFPKCGTSAMLRWLDGHREIDTIPDESNVLQTGNGPEAMVRIFHERRASNINKQGNATNTLPTLLGYKHPHEIQYPMALRRIRDYFPHAKIIIGIRHPVRMIESFYNYRIQNEYDMRLFKELTDGPSSKSHEVYFNAASYQRYLANLGRTNPNTAQRITPQPPKRLPNPVFLYDIEQMGDADPARMNGFLQDLQNFLGLNSPLTRPPRFRPGKLEYNNTEKQEELNARKIDICNDTYLPEREKLLRIGAEAGEWILDRFLPKASPPIYVSNPDHFREILQRYGQDPCRTGT